MNRIKFHQAKRQRGIATLLILLLVGIAISAAIFGSLRYIQGSQDQTTAFHAQTQAQLKAWSGVDMIYQYFLELGSDRNFGWDDLEENLDVGTLLLNGNPSAVVADVDPGNQRITVNITGTSGTATRAASTSTVQAVYLIKDDGGSGGSCNMKASTIFRGGISITGGETEFISGIDLTDIAVEGNMTLSSAAKAGVSGCASGNVTMSGGGIKDNSTLYVGGDFKVTSMAEPKKATVWAQNIQIDNTGAANYTALKTGAYRADVLDGTGAKIGTASVGGKLIVGTTGMDIPWKTGTIVPFTDHGFVVQLTDDSQFLLKLGAADIDASTGMVNNHTYEILSGEGGLPSTLQFKATGINGGDLDIYTLIVGQLWGHSVAIRGWSGNYTEVLANGNFDVVTGTVGKLTGGGALSAIEGYWNSSTNYGSVPIFNAASNIAGSLKLGSYSGVPTLPNLAANVPGISPGLPGAPYCDTRINEVNASSFKSQANYIFEFVDDKPQLTIQKVELADGRKIDGVYALSSADVRQLHDHPFLACGWGSNHCFRNSDTEPSKGWNLTGIFDFPPGIAWFDGSVTINGVAGSKDILATLVSAGDVTLTSSGHGKLIAPNFNPTVLCQGNFRPTNLCTLSGHLATWNEDDMTYDGLPLGNVAVLAEGKLDTRGWTIDGHVILGQNITTSANQSVINGRLIVGANARINTQIQQGGFKVVTDKLTGAQLQMPSCRGGSSPGRAGVKLLWSRYL